MARENKKQDRRQHAQNLNGLNINGDIAENKKQKVNINHPPSTPNVQVVKRVKTVYWLHNRIHVQEKLHAPTMVRELIKILRKADSTVLVLPFDENGGSQNDETSNENNIPDKEDEIKNGLELLLSNHDRNSHFP